MRSTLQHTATPLHSQVADRLQTLTQSMGETYRYSRLQNGRSIRVLHLGASVHEFAQGHIIGREAYSL
jgi:hypothetical protein